LSTTLAKQGTIAIPDLVLALQDEHWYMVRNVVAILGQIGESRTASHLHPLLWHEDLRIARETVRALARLGGEQAVKSLLQLVDSGHRELYPQAIIALGIMRNPAAVPSLVKIIKTRDPFMKKTELKTSAIKALGRIGAPEAATELEILAKRRPLWGRAKRTSLRIQAIAALGQIGSPSSKPVLEALTHERDQRIAHSALRIMKQWPEL
jgi:HEAT repeat protein